MINYIYVHPLKVRGKINYPFPNFNGGTVEVWELINNFISHFTGHVITYPCWDWSWSMLVKRAPCRYEYHNCIVIIWQSKTCFKKCIAHLSGHLIFTGICSVLYLSLRFVFIVKWNIKHNTSNLQYTYKLVNHSIFQYHAFSSIYRYVKSCTLFA